MAGWVRWWAESPIMGGRGGAVGMARLVGWWAGGPIGRNIQLETALMCCVRNALRTSWNRLLEKG